MRLFRGSRPVSDVQMLALTEARHSIEFHLVSGVDLRQVYAELFFQLPNLVAKAEDVFMEKV